MKGSAWLLVASDYRKMHKLTFWWWKGNTDYKCKDKTLHPLLISITRKKYSLNNKPVNVILFLEQFVNQEVGNRKTYKTRLGLLSLISLLGKARDSILNVYYLAYSLDLFSTSFILTAVIKYQVYIHFSNYLVLISFPRKFHSILISTESFTFHELYNKYMYTHV